MTLTDNNVWLKKKAPEIWGKLQDVHFELQSNDVIVETSKSGLPTLLFKQNEREIYIHSKYDPLNEADQILDQFKNMELYKHVFFYGIGLGYHIDAFSKRFPEINFSIYEPRIDIFRKFLTLRNLNDWPKLKDIYIENNMNDLQRYISHFVSNIKEQVLIINLPSYERLFQDRFNLFVTSFKNTISIKTLSFITDSNYEKLWTVNSVLNFNKVFNSESMIKHKRHHFQGKPIIIVAAGPSLQEEIENLKYIKKNKLAYIFSVGSAIKALIQQEIYPDAACTYDPQLHNYKVIEDITNRSIGTIPLIFGSSVGYQTLDNFSGTMIHMLTFQDTISKYFIAPDEAEFVSDAPTISIVTFHLAMKLGCSNVIFVGQNFGYRDNQYYSKGIEYVNRPNKITEEESRKLQIVEGVEGEQVYTIQSFTIARNQLEEFISQYHGAEIINTTNGGAKIKNTVYIPLSELIETRLKKPVVTENWYHDEGKRYSKDYVEKRIQMMDLGLKSCEKSFQKILSLFRDLNYYAEKKLLNEINNLFTKFDKTIDKLFKNDFYQIFLLPMTRVEREIFNKSISDIRSRHNDPIAKAKEVIKIFGKYIYVCERDFVNIRILYDEMKKSMNNN